MLVYAGIWQDTGFCKRPVFSAGSIEIPKYLGSSLSGVECRNTAGAQHRTGCWYHYDKLRGREPLAVYTLERRSERRYRALQRRVSEAHEGCEGSHERVAERGEFDVERRTT
jgi:hypothetical protein